MIDYHDYLYTVDCDDDCDMQEVIDTCNSNGFDHCRVGMTVYFWSK